MYILKKSIFKDDPSKVDTDSTTWGSYTALIDMEDMFLQELFCVWIKH